MAITLPLTLITTRTGGGTNPWVLTLTIKDASGIVLSTITESRLADISEGHIVLRQMEFVKQNVRFNIYKLLPANVTFTFDPWDTAKSWVLS